MKHLIIICLSLFTIHQISAQDQTIETEKKNLDISHSFGVNVKSIIGITDFGFFVSDPTPFAFNYNLNVNKVGFRASFGGEFRNSKNDSDDQIVRENKTRQANYRLGIHYKVLQRKKFNVKLGLDGVRNNNYYYYSTQQPGSTEVTYENYLTQTGFGPSIQLEYEINDFISISTESWYYISYISQENKRNENGQEYIETSNGWQSDLYQPSLLYLNIRF